MGRTLRDYMNEHRAVYRSISYLKEKKDYVRSKL